MTGSRILIGSEFMRSFPKPLVVSKSLKGNKSKLVKDYVASWVKNANPKGKFYKKTRFIRRLPGSIILRLLRGLKYDGLLFEKNGKVAVHVFFQRHGNALHMFSVAAEQGFGGKGLATEALEGFLEYARAVPEIKSVRIGAGEHKGVMAIFKKFKQREHELKIIVRDGGWIDFPEKQ